MKNQIADLTWPRGRSLVLIGPTDKDPRVHVRTPNKSHWRSWPLPRDGDWIHAEVAGLSFGIQVQRRSGCRLGLDVPPECVVARRQWKGRRAG
jgi:hypothetical protein